jgi:hypothetical protein
LVHVEVTRYDILMCCKDICHTARCIGVLISPQPALLPDAFFIVRIFRFDASCVIYIYIYIYSTNIPPIMIINRIYENQNLLSL